ncbi:hypothetical protein [Streptomyces cyaneofuscatus]|uniref:hypothetical protein n=1 Tax=Streptomyces cyaneofuscatus TaxID=66883 RepID=UPI00378F2D07
MLRGRNWLAPDFARQERQDDSKRWDAIVTREMTGTLARLNAPEHTCRRRSFGNLSDRSTIERLTPDVERDTDRLLDEPADKLRWGEADFVSTVSEQLPIHTVGSWRVLPPEDYPHILEITTTRCTPRSCCPPRAGRPSPPRRPWLIREVGAARVRELIPTGRAFDAAEAQALSALQRVVPENEWDQADEAWAKPVVRRPEAALRVTKALLNSYAAATRMADPPFLDAELMASVAAAGRRTPPRTPGPDTSHS